MPPPVRIAHRRRHRGGFLFGSNPKRDRSPLLALAGVLVRRDHGASFVVNADLGIMGAAVMLRVVDSLRDHHFLSNHSTASHASFGGVCSHSSVRSSYVLASGLL